MIRASATTRRKDAKRELEQKLRDLQSDNSILNEAVGYAGSDRLSFDEKKRNSLYDSASRQADRLNTLSALLRSNRDIYEAEYGKEYVDELTKFASQGSTYGEIANRVKTKNDYASQFADENDYNNWQQYGGLTRPMLKTVSEKLENDYTNAKKSGNTAAMDSSKNSLAWVNSRIKSMTDVGSMSIEEMQNEYADVQKSSETLSSLNRQKQEIRKELSHKKNKGRGLSRGGSTEEKYQNMSIEELETELANLDSQIDLYGDSDVAYFDNDGNAITWDKAIDTKIRGSYKNMSLEEIEKKRKEAAAEVENSKTKFLGITMPSGEATSAQSVYDAWESAYQVKKAEENKKNPDWVEKSKPVIQKSSDKIYDYINNINNIRKVSKSQALEEVGLNEDVLKYQEMDSEEIGAYNYIYATEGKEKAEDYLKAITPELNRRLYEADVTRQNQIGGVGLTGENILSVGRNTVEAIPAALSTIKNWATNTPIDPYGTEYRLLNMSDTTRAETSKRIEENIGGVGGDVVDFLYGTAMSGLDSAATIPINMIIPGSGLVIMGSRAGVSATNEAIKKGISQDKAMLTGLMAGGFEAAFEKIPLDRLTDVLKNGKKATSGLFKTLLKEGGINAEEEFLTTLSTEMADRMINGDLSNYAVNIEKYRLEGLPTEEARKKANTDFALQLAQDAAAGFLQGFSMTAGASAVNTAYNKSVGGNIADKNNVGVLVEKAKALKGSEELNGLITEVEGFDTEKLSGKQKATIGKLYNLALNEAQQQLTDGTASKNKIKSAIVSRLTELKSQNISATADAIVKNINGEKLSKEESNTISNNPVAQRVISEIENAGSQDYTSDWASDVIADTMTERSAGVKAFQEIQNLANATSENVVTGQQKAKASGIAVNPQNIDTYTEGEKVIGSAVKSLKTAQNGNILVEFENGSTKALSDVELSETSAEVVAYAKDYGEYANIFLQTYKQGTTESVDEFAKEFNYAYESGKIGATLDYVQNSDYTKSLTPTQIQNAWEVGRQMSETEAKSGSVATYEEYHANKKAGKVTVDKSINTKRLNHNQISAMYAVRGIARATGINIVLENKGLVRDTNGAYDPNTNTIYLDINAGKYGLNFGEYAMLRTLSHELTHYIRYNNKAAYKQLQDFIFSKLSDYKGKSIDELVAAEQYEGMSFEDAAEEVVARACETMLRDSVAIEALYNENRGLFNTIKNFIANFKKAVYRAFDRVGARSEAAKAMLQYTDELQTLWDNALVGAVHNQQGKGNQVDGRNAKAIKNEKTFTEDENNVNQNAGLLARREVSAVGGSGNSVWQQGGNSEKLARYLGTNSEFEGKIPEGCRAGESGWVLQKDNTQSGQEGHTISLLRRISRVVPSGKDTIGRRISPGTSEKFANTVFKDEDGNLLSLYHWTTAEFEEFAKGEFGFHFGTLDAAHDRYSAFKEANADTPRGNYKEVFLNITNPIELSDNLGCWEAGWVAEQLVDKGIITEHQYDLLSITTGFYETTYNNPAAQAVRDILGSKGYDGIIYRNESEDAGSFSVIAFHPEQILTVAENGVLKENNGVTEGDDSSIRYERAEITEDEVISQSKKAMAAELTRLRELLKMQGRESHGTVFTKSSVDLVAAELIRETDSRLTKAELAPLLNKLYARIASDKELNFEEVMDEAREIADKINEQARLRKFQDPRKQEIKEYIRKNSIYISQEALAEGRAHFGGAKEFANAWRGKIKFTTTDKSAMPIDTLWREAQGLYGEYFDSEVFREPEMAYKLVEIYNQLNEDATADFSDYYSDEIREQTAYDIYDGFWRVNTLHTVADKYAKKMRQLKSAHKTRLEKLRAESEQTIKDLKSANREKIKSVYEKLRAESEQTIKDLKSANREKIKSVYEKRDKANEIRSISKKANALYKKLKDNSAKSHIPEPLKKPLGDFLMNLDFSSNSMLDNAALTLADAKFSERLSALNNILKNYAGDTAKVLDIRDETTSELDELYNDITKKIPKGESFTINKMTVAELKTLRKFLTEISKAITNADKALAEVTTQRISELGYETIDDLKDMKTYQPFSNEKLKNTSTITKWDMKIPFYAFNLYGRGGKTIFKGLMNGWGNFARNVKAITDFADGVYTEKEVQNWKSNVQTYKLSDGDLQMTDAIAMYLYVAVKREQARKHLFGAGLAVEEFEQKGKSRNVVQKGQHFSIEDIAEIESHLTERQKEVANKLQQFMGEECAEWGNVVSMKRHGIKIFTEKNYIPIKTLEGGDAISDKDAERSLYRLLNLSFTKATNINANNSLVARDIFDVFTEHTTDMAKYNALALPVLDAVRWANFQETTESDTGEININSVKKSLDNAYGKDAMDYIDKFLKSLSGVKDGGTSRVEKFLTGFLKNFKIAAVAANLRVAFLQLSSYVRAGAVLSQKSLNVANFKKLPSADLVNRYSGMALWKSMGYFDINVARGVREQIAKQSKVKDKIIEKSMWLTSKADEYTLRKLWTACEYEISKQNPNLKKGSEEYNKAVGEKLDEVIMATQVVDSTITRAPIMREKSATTQQLAAFMSEPLVTLNVMTDGFLQMQNDVRKGMPKAQAVKKHFSNLMKLSAIFFSQAVVTSLLESLWDAWRDDEDDEYILKFLRALPNNLYENANILNQVPVLNDFLDDLENTLILPYADKLGVKETAELIFGKDYSQNAKAEFSQFYYDIKDAAKKWSKIASGESDNYYGAVYKTATALSRTSGLPFSNVLREGVSLYNNIVDFMGKEDLKFRTYEPTAADMWDSFERNFENKDTTKMKKVVDDMLNEKTEKYISEGATKQEAKAKASTSVRSSFTRRYKKLYQEAYKAKDTKECARIYRLAQSSKLYPNTQATISGWKRTD